MGELLNSSVVKWFIVRRPRWRSGLTIPAFFLLMSRWFANILIHLKYNSLAVCAIECTFFPFCNWSFYVRNLFAGVDVKKGVQRVRDIEEMSEYSKQIMK
jgi:hypothetical protein